MGRDTIESLTMLNHMNAKHSKQLSDAEDLLGESVNQGSGTVS